MKAIMACVGGRAPPGQNTRSPCAGSHWLGEAPDSPARGLSAWLPCRWSGQACARCRPRPSSPTRSASATYSLSCPLSRRSPPTATHAHPRDPPPSAPHGRGPQAKTCSLSCSSWLHLLRSGSLRQTRGGSGTWPGGTSLGNFDVDLIPQRTHQPRQGTPFKAICPGLLSEYTTDGVLQRDRHYWRAPVGRVR